MKDWVKIGRKIVDKLLKENEHRSDEILAGIDGERFHTVNTHNLVMLLTNNTASPSLQIAAMAHDVERFSVKGAGGGFKKDRRGKEYEEYKKRHAKKGAEIMKNELAKSKASKELVKRVKFLISHHDDTEEELREINDEELKILVAADSLSWLNFSAPNYFNLKEKKGHQGLIDKMDFMLEKLPERFWKYLTKIKLTEPKVSPYLKERIKIIAQRRNIKIQ